ncbi:hypothetical protein AUJ69_03505 [Candidatus Woesearchaeota archaeon CG1_02_47_18]|nr:MAG: hypothetical protein AUJ69_03505 [Candidatus Woesearchaeota archaeon CG1_02_47_18]
MNVSEALKLRRAIKARKPHFRMSKSDKHGRGEIRGKGWRKPRGRHSKLRRKLKGHGRRPAAGFGSPRLARGRDRNGLIPVIVKNPDKLSLIDPKSQSIVIAASVGAKKRIEILKRAIKDKIQASNIAPKAFMDGLVKGFEERREVRQQRKKEKGEKKAEEKKKKTIEEKVKGEQSPDEKRMAEIEEQNRVLTRGE